MGLRYTGCMQGPNQGVRPNQAPPPREVWCEEHRRPVGPDGRCSLCVEGDDPARSERRVVLVVVALALLGGIGPAAYYFFWARHTEDRQAAARTTQATAPGPRGQTGPMMRQERWVDEETPPKDVKPDPREVAREKRRARRETKARQQATRRRGRPGGGRAGLNLTARPRARPRAAGWVPITMYMAHW